MLKLIIFLEIFILLLSVIEFGTIKLFKMFTISNLAKANIDYDMTYKKNIVIAYISKANDLIMKLIKKLLKLY